MLLGDLNAYSLADSNITQTLQDTTKIMSTQQRHEHHSAEF
jgi:hypothetical protein